MVTISKVTMIIASKCGRFWALHILVQCPFRYFSCGKRNEIFRLRWSRVKADSIGPIHTAEVSLQQRFRGGRQSRNLVGVISHEISAEPWNLCGQRLQCCAEKKTATAVCLRHPRFFSVLGYLRARRFFCEMRSHGPKARFNANQQQKIARAHPSGAFKDGKVWFAKNVKNSNWKRQSRGQGTADERDWGRCAKYPPENTRKGFLIKLCKIWH